MIVSHACKSCPTVLTYEQRTNRRVYCAPCKIVAHKASQAVTQKLRRQRYGRLSIKTWRQLEKEEWHVGQNHRRDRTAAVCD